MQQRPNRVETKFIRALHNICHICVCLALVSWKQKTFSDRVENLSHMVEKCMCVCS